MHRSESTISPEMFAVQMVKDEQLDPVFVDAIAGSIRRQINTFETYTPRDPIRVSLHPIFLDIRINDVVVSRT